MKRKITRASSIKHLHAPKVHPGPVISATRLSACNCAGCAVDELSTSEIDGYAVYDRQDLNNEIILCRACAMRMAVSIFEQEGL